MPDFVSLTCSSCGGKLQIPAGIEQFACGYCGTEFTVNRGGGIVSLAPVVEGLKHVQRGVDKTASELAIARLQRDADGLTQQWQSVKAQSYLALSGWGTFLLVAGVLLSCVQPVLGAAIVIVGIVLLVSAFNGSRKKVQQLKEIEQQHAVMVSEINKHKVTIGQ